MNGWHGLVVAAHAFIAGACVILAFLLESIRLHRLRPPAVVITPELFFEIQRTAREIFMEGIEDARREAIEAGLIEDTGRVEFTDIYWK